MWLNQLCLKRHLRKWQNVHKMNRPWLSDTASDQLAYRSWLKVYRKLWSKLTYLAGSLFPTLFQSHMMIGCLPELGTDRNQRKFHKEGNPLKGMMQWDWWRSQSTAIPESNNAKQANFPNDDVFIQPQGSFSTSRTAQNIGSKSQSSRTSVIRRMENVESQNLYQDNYNIPVF